MTGDNTLAGPQRKKGLFMSIICISLLWWAVLLSGSQQTDSRQSSAQKLEKISLHEAEILIYLLPAAVEVRRQGMDVAWELQDSDAYNQKDFYIFWVYNKDRTGTASVTIGYFAVNKHKADVWDLVFDSLVQGKEIERVQTILRRAHAITEDTVRRFRMLNPHAASSPM